MREDFSGSAACARSRLGTMGFGRAAPVLALAFVMTLANGARAQEQEKNPEDPTKIATKIGIGYSDEGSISGSLAFGPLSKVNARVSQSGQWSVGASYLFPFAILTFSAGKNDFDNGSSQTRYSLGGFVPLSQLGLKTGKWQLFTPFGYTYTDGEQAVSDVQLGETFIVELSSSSAYAGLFALRPINEKWTFLAAGIASKGTEDFSGYSIGGGLSYHLNEKNTIAVYGSYVDNSFGQEEKFGISLRHEF